MRDVKTGTKEMISLVHNKTSGQCRLFLSCYNNCLLGVLKMKLNYSLFSISRADLLASYNVIFLFLGVAETISKRSHIQQKKHYKNKIKHRSLPGAKRKTV